MVHGERGSFGEVSLLGKTMHGNGYGKVASQDTLERKEFRRNGRKEHVRDF